MKVGATLLILNVIIVILMVLFARGYGPLLFHLALVAKILEEVSTAFWYVYEDYESDL